MRPLEMIIQVLTWTSLYPPEENTSKSRKQVYVCILVSIMTVMFCSFIGFGTFFIKFVSADLESALTAVTSLCSSSSTLYMLVFSFLTRSRIKSIFDSLSDIYDERKYLFDEGTLQICEITS